MLSWAGDSYGRLKGLLVILAHHPTHLIHASSFPTYQELQFPEFVLLLHRQDKKVQSVGGKKNMLPRQSWEAVLLFILYFNFS